MLFCGVMARSFQARAEDAVAPEKLIENLENGDFDQRRAAQKQLEATGEPARSALEKALARSESIETRDTLERLLSALQRSQVVLEAVDEAAQPITDAQADVLVQPASPASLIPVGEPLQPKNMTADARGAIVLGGLTPGFSYLNVTWKNYHLAKSGNVLPYIIYLPRGETRLRYVLEKGASLTGQVLDETKKLPLAASVTLLSDTGQEWDAMDVDRWLVQMGEAEGLKGDADEKGRFAIPNIPPGRYFVFCQHAEYMTSAGHAVVAERDRASTLETPVLMTPKSKALGAVQVKIADANGDLMKGKTFEVSLHKLMKKEMKNSREQLQQLMMRGMFEVNAESEMQQLQTTEEGLLELKELRPGAYRLRLVFDGTVKWLLPEVIVAPGKTTEIDKTPPAKLGHITGRISNAAGTSLSQVTVWPLNWADAESMLLMNDLPRYSAWLSTGETAVNDAAITDDSGKFEIKGLPPGRYTLCLLRNSKVQGLVHDIEITAEKTTAVPAIKLSSPGVQNANTHVQGVVQLADGNSAANATVTLLGKVGSSSGTNTAENGAFTLNDQLDNGTAYLVATLEGYRPLWLDMSTPGLDLANLKLRLEKQAYGSVLVTVRDSAGNPLKGASVAPELSRAHAFSNPQFSGRNTTDNAGRVVLKGLAWGQRFITAACDGYYLETPAELTVIANAETPLIITLKTGLTVKGIVEIPAGVDWKKIRIGLEDVGTEFESTSAGIWRAWRLSGVDQTGRFVVTGLRPSKVRFVAQCPGMLLEPHALFDVTPAMAEIKLKLLPAHKVRITLGPEHTTSQLSLVDARHWNPMDNGRSRIEPQSLSVCNSLGHGDFYALPAGTYHLLMSPSESAAFTQETQHSVRATRIVRDIRIPVAGGARVLPEISVKAASVTGTVKGRIRINMAEAWPASESGVGGVGLVLVGEGAVASLTLSLPDGVDPAFATVELGQKPKGYTPAVPGEFEMTGLQPGEYSLYACFKSHRGSGWSWQLQEIKEKPRLLKTFKISGAGPTDLGESVMELQKDVYTQMVQEFRKMLASNAELSSGSGLGEDEAAEFQP